MMRNRYSVAVLASALMLGFGLSPAKADGAPASGPQGPVAGMDQPRSRSWVDGPMARRLQLTDAQKTSLKAIQARHQDALKAKRKAAMEARRAFSEALRKPETPPDTLKALNRTLADARFDARQERRAMRQEMHAVLTPEQREKVARMEGFREGRRMARGGGWREGGPMRTMDRPRSAPDTLAP
jgi:Spy/CpxP family protein refolding chaperone